MKDIYFVKFKNNAGSCKLRLFQIFNKLKELKINVFLLDLDEIIKQNINNSIIFIIKKIYDYNKIQIIKQNNIIIYDFIDLMYKDGLNKFNTNFNFFKLIDYYVVNSIYMKKKLKHIINKKIFVIYHHWDYDLINTKIQKSNFIKFIYIGSVKKLNYNSNKIIKFNSPFELNKSNLCHLTFIDNNTNLFIHHTSTKLATCCFFESIFIVNKVPVFVELLGNDYDFICDNNIESFEEKINYAIKIYNTDIWFKNLLIIQKLKTTLSLNNIIKSYIKMFNYVK